MPVSGPVSRGLLQGDAVSGGDRRQLGRFRPARGGRGVELGKHPVEADAGYAENEEAGRLGADVAVAMAAAARTKNEAARRDAMGRRLILEFDQQLAAQDVEGFILARMGVRRRPTARRDDGFPKREQASGLGS